MKTKPTSTKIRTALPKAILFDLGGTVLKEHSYDLAKGFTAISSHLLPGADINKLIGDMKRPHGPLTEFKLLDWLSEHSDNPAGCSQPAPAHELEWTLWESTVSLSPQPNVDNALAHIAASGIRVAAITNTVFSSACVVKELARHGLRGYFEFVLSSADIGLKKPHPDVFITALNTLGVKAQESIYIGDTLKADIEGSAAVGITPIWFGKNVDSEHYKTLKQWSEFNIKAHSRSFTY